MRLPLVVGIILVICTSYAVAGEVYGTITEQNKAVPTGTKVEVSVSGKVYDGTTDKFGSYRIVVNEKGKGTVTVHLNQQAASATVFSYEKATRYDWIVESANGKLSIRRK